MFRMFFAKTVSALELRNIILLEATYGYRNTGKKLGRYRVYTSFVGKIIRIYSNRALFLSKINIFFQSDENLKFFPVLKWLKRRVFFPVFQIERRPAISENPKNKPHFVVLCWNFMIEGGYLKVVF